MRLKNFLRSALPLLCCVALLSQIPTTARQTPKPGLEGTYVLDDPAAEQTIRKAIKEGVKGLGWPVGGIASARLEKTNLPPYGKINIKLGACLKNVSITTDKRAPIVTTPDGTPEDWTREDKEKLKVSTILTDAAGPLKQTFKSRDGERVNTYTLSPDGKTLTMQVLVSSERLKHPVSYALTYKRTP